MMFTELAPGLIDNLILTAALSLGIQIVLWLVSMKTRDATIADWWWGMGYATIALVTYANTYGVGVESRKLLITVLTVIWGVRLSVHLIARSVADRRELDRYENYRKEATAKGEHLQWYLYKKIFGIQGVMMWIVSLPVQVAQFYLKPVELGIVALIGCAIWVIGFSIESYTDWQLAQFKADPANKGKILNSGLWYYTRHPNYFGEALVWWGIFLIACDNWIGLVTILSPIRMHHRMAHRQGIGWLEKKMSTLRPEYADYIARTNRFYPWPPKAAGKEPGASGNTGLSKS